jgi:hypothetical protein
VAHCELKVTQGIKRLIFYIECFLCGALIDFGIFHAAEIGSKIYIPEFNYAFTCFFRAILIALTIGHSGAWITCVGQSTAFQRFAFWLLTIVSIVVPDFPAALRIHRWLDVVNIAVVVPFAIGCVCFIWVVRNQARSFFHELSEGEDLDEVERVSPMLARAYFIHFPPERRIDMLPLDLFVLFGIVYVVRGSWFVVS